MPRTYERKFDWDEARRLRSLGRTYPWLSEHFGVSISALRHVCVPREGAHSRAYTKHRQHTGGICIECGGQTSLNHSVGPHRCRPCSNRYRARSTVREDALWCFRCREWKTDDQYCGDRQQAHRRGKSRECRPCATKSRGERRRRQTARQTQVLH